MPSKHTPSIFRLFSVTFCLFYWYNDLRQKPRGIKVNGTAEIVEHNGMFGPGKYLQIAPTVSWSWGIKDFGSQRKENFLSRLFTLVIDRGSNTALLRSNVNKGSNHREPHFSYDVVSLAPIN